MYAEALAFCCRSKSTKSLPNRTCIKKRWFWQVPLYIALQHREPCEMEDAVCDKHSGFNLCQVERLYVWVWYRQSPELRYRNISAFSISFDKITFLNRSWFFFQGKGNMKSSWIFHFIQIHKPERFPTPLFWNLIRPQYILAFLSHSFSWPVQVLTFFNCLPWPCWFQSPGIGRERERGRKEETSF